MATYSNRLGIFQVLILPAPALFTGWGPTWVSGLLDAPPALMSAAGTGVWGCGGDADPGGFCPHPASHSAWRGVWGQRKGLPTAFPGCLSWVSPRVSRWLWGRTAGPRMASGSLRCTPSGTVQGGGQGRGGGGAGGASDPRGSARSDSCSPASLEGQRL